MSPVSYKTTDFCRIHRTYLGIPGHARACRTVHLGHMSCTASSLTGQEVIHLAPYPHGFELASELRIKAVCFAITKKCELRVDFTLEQTC